MRIKKGDNVQVLAGKDKGKKGAVEAVFPGINKALVAGVNVVTKHQKPTKGAKQVGRITKSMPIQASNLAIFCSKCSKPTRVGHKILSDGRKERICKKCQEAI